MVFPLTKIELATGMCFVKFGAMLWSKNPLERKLETQALMTQYLAILISDFTTNTINEIIMSKRAIGKIELIFKKATWYLRGRIELLIIPKTSTITPLTNILKVVLFDV